MIEPNQIICADSLDIMRDMPDDSVDKKNNIVVKKPLTNSTESGIMGNYEKQTRATKKTDSRKAVESTQERDNLALQRPNVVSGENSQVLRNISDGDGQGTESVTDTLKQQGQNRQDELSVQGWKPERSLSPDDREGRVREVQGNGDACNSPQKRRPSGQPAQESANTVRELPQQLPQETLVENQKIICITDPPYGINIAEWDSEIPPQRYFDEIFRVTHSQIIFGGNYFSLPHSEGWLCWDKTYRYAQKLNIGEFELAWTSFDIKATFYRYTCCGNFRGLNEKVRAYYDKDPNVHPTQKPVELFVEIIRDFTEPNDLIFDPFCGSGTTCVAAKRLGRRYIGVDISEEYCQIARDRLAAEEAGLTVKEMKKGQRSMFQ